MKSTEIFSIRSFGQTTEGSRGGFETRPYRVEGFREEEQGGVPLRNYFPSMSIKSGSSRC
jgi:hypothetical protein